MVEDERKFRRLQGNKVWHRMRDFSTALCGLCSVLWEMKFDEVLPAGARLCKKCEAIAEKEGDNEL